jgi:hypothetical protein
VWLTQKLLRAKWQTVPTWIDSLMESELSRLSGGSQVLNYGIKSAAINVRFDSTFAEMEFDVSSSKLQSTPSVASCLLALPITKYLS